MPNSALYWLKNKIFSWNLRDIIKSEQYFKISHLSLLYRLLSLNFINSNEFNEYKLNVTHETEKLSYDISFYKSSSESQQYFSLDELIRFIQGVFENNKISQGKRREILLKSYISDMIYDIDKELGLLD